MSRRSITDYCGAVGRIDIGKVSKLGHRHVVQIKHDGLYVQISTDAKGQVVNVISRNGLPVREAADLLGIRFIPNATLAAELDAHSECGNRLAALRGFRLAHIFDAIRIEGRYLAREPYRVRRDELHRALAVLELREGNGKHWTEDSDGRAHDARGRYSRRVPRSWRRFPLVDQHPISHAADMFERAKVSGDIEGAVVVALDAPLGKRGAKRKLKPTTTLDAVVVQVSGKYVRAHWAGGSVVVGVGRHAVRVGSVVEIGANGLYEASATPRFARLLRVRTDIQQGETR